MSYANASLTWTAAQLKMNIREEPNIGLVTDEHNYRLPQDCLWVIYASWNSNKLTPASVYKWDRDGTNWRSSTSTDVLQEYAVLGRQIILNPAPAAGAITTDAFLRLRYIAGATLSNEDQLELNDMACWVAIYKAAVMYLRAHPSDQAQAMIQGMNEDLSEFLLQAKRQSFEPIETYSPGFRPLTERRSGAR